MKIREATVDDAQVLGRVMVESFLAAHQGQIPDEAWRKRVDEWTPDVSARGWARVLADQAVGNAPRDVLLVAEDDAGAVNALLYGIPADDDLSGATARISALYVAPDAVGRGIGAALVKASARTFADLGFAALTLDVLTSNRPARGFYEAIGGVEVGRGTVDEEGSLLPVTVYGWADLTALIGE